MQLHFRLTVKFRQHVQLHFRFTVPSRNYISGSLCSSPLTFCCQPEVVLHDTNALTRGAWPAERAATAAHRYRPLTAVATFKHSDRRCIRGPPSVQKRPLTDVHVEHTYLTPCNSTYGQLGRRRGTASACTPVRACIRMMYQRMSSGVERRKQQRPGNATSDTNHDPHNSTNKPTMKCRYQTAHEQRDNPHTCQLPSHPSNGVRDALQASYYICMTRR